ncbi:hypothetical protein FKM82_007353 [Ascaphus truei]
MFPALRMHCACAAYIRTPYRRYRHLEMCLIISHITPIVCVLLLATVPYIKYMPFENAVLSPVPWWYCACALCTVVPNRN